MADSPLNAAAAIAVELEKVQATVYPQLQQDCLIYNRLRTSPTTKFQIV